MGVTLIWMSSGLDGSDGWMLGGAAAAAGGGSTVVVVIDEAGCAAALVVANAAADVVADAPPTRPAVTVGGAFFLRVLDCTESQLSPP